MFLRSVVETGKLLFLHHYASHLFFCAIDSYVEHLFDQIVSSQHIIDTGSSDAVCSIVTDIFRQIIEVNLNRSSE